SGVPSGGSMAPPHGICPPIPAVRSPSRSTVRRTKIVATLGPASDRPEVIDALLHAGMDMARLGLAHGTPEVRLALRDRLRERGERPGRTVGIVADLPGPKVRTGEFPEGGAFLAEGDE